MTDRQEWTDALDKAPLSRGVYEPAAGGGPVAARRAIRIGDLARHSGFTVETIRYYERERLLQAPPRSGGNYRLYGPDDIERLAFIRLCRALDMSLDEIRTLLQLRSTPDEDCSGAKRLVFDHLRQVRARMRELRTLERQLLRLAEACQEPACADQCGVLRELNHDASQALSRQAGPGS